VSARVWRSAYASFTPFGRCGPFHSLPPDGTDLSGCLRSGKISLAYNVTSSLPVSVFIDKSGRVDLIQLGALTPDLLEQEIQKLS